MQNNPNYSVTHSKVRSFYQAPIAGDPNTVNNAIAPLLSQEGYSLTNIKENGADVVVWKKGTGFLTAMKFIKVLYQPNMMIISGWIASGLGSLTFLEKSLDGVYGVVPKKSCIKTIEKVIQVAQSIPPQPQQNFVPQQPQQ